MMAGCSLNPGGSLLSSGVVVEKVHLSKQRQKIAYLQKKLAQAEKEQKKVDDEVDRLSEELHIAQLFLIRTQVSAFETELNRLKEDAKEGTFFLTVDRENLFLKERDMLQNMMENGSPSSAFEAQVVLDRILRIITTLKDGSERY